MNTEGISGAGNGTFLWITVSNDPQVFDEDFSAMHSLFTFPYNKI